VVLEERLLVSVEIGQILALVGMVLLVLGSHLRQRGRKQGKLGTPEFLRQQRWLNGVALGLVLVGLLLMWAKK
jgi:murein DD-endopeptidase MepM/ murein hydrolase activator NlpD